MTLPRTIVVGTDFSEPAEVATRYAIELATKLDASVHLVFGWMMPATATPMELPAIGPLYDELAEDAQRAMAATTERHRNQQVPVDGAVIFADARDAIASQAVKLNAELVVVGTHGRRGLRRAVMGSVAEAIVRSAPCPVLVVR